MKNKDEFDLLSEECRIFEEYLKAERVEKINRVLANRGGGLALIMEALVDPHNIAASLRAAEAIGIQKVSVIMSDGEDQFTPHNAVSSGAHKWLTIDQYSNPQECVKNLKDQGFLICASCDGEKSQNLNSLPKAEKVALVFGNEKDGISDYMKENADHLFWMPFSGFTQVLNVSVATALCLSKARDMGLGGQRLDEMEKIRLKNHWMRLSLKTADSILESRGFLRDKKA